MELSDIISAIIGERVIATRHARLEAIDDGLEIGEICQATISGEIIEDYPNDYPFPSCLALGYLSGGDPIHAVWAYNEDARRAHLVTVYRPDPTRWINWRIRRIPNENQE